MKFSIIAVVALILSTTLVSQSHGMTITVVDPNSDFSVTYDPDEAGFFGVLVLSHNTIFFAPDSFIATSADGGASALISETLTMTLTATTSGFSFDSFFLQETGDYIVDGASSEVSVSGQMRVREVSNLLDEYLDGFGFVANGDQGPNQIDWSGTSEINADDGWFGTGEQVMLTLQNTLTASTDFHGDQAFIQKKSTGVAIQVNPIPIPAAFWLFASGLFFLLRRRS